MSTNREVNLIGAGQLVSDQFASSVQVFGELGSNVELDSASIEPFVGISYVYLSSRRFNETGGLAGSERAIKVIASHL
ncbi:autotransporter outer membrane beta-barrel domain-containing protein [Pseudovibrio sp. Tun.PSC04-5.I4]|uniref:autotransporter domain-containing protein n=1 Tax=Pseudovibrio sp. Tun.PSC04-5.I4 TaxID=1798213 RepID=UPI000B83514B|nr:autotransporter outer membrane beta-barrel domain-containing protein [Pseudovibrio sp. Tun.PSC04-5.I4]